MIAIPFNGLHVELDRESDGRWIAEVTDVPGVLAYGATWIAAMADAMNLFCEVMGRLNGGRPRDFLWDGTTVRQRRRHKSHDDWCVIIDVFADPYQRMRVRKACARAILDHLKNDDLPDGVPEIPKDIIDAIYALTKTDEWFCQLDSGATER